MKKNKINQIQTHILTGTSHMIPFIVIGGVMYSLASVLGNSENGIVEAIAQIGDAGFHLFVPVLGAYIAYSIANRPGLAPGMVGAYLAQEMNMGFIGGIIAGFIAGYTVHMVKKIKLPMELKSIGTIFLYPLIGSLITGGIIILILGQPVAFLMETLQNAILHLGKVGKIPLGIILGAMTAVDMGGPINKVATLFAQTQVDTLPYLMGGVGVAISTPSIGMGLATCLSPKKYSEEERQFGKGAILMGLVGVTEGAIPYASNDPKTVLPSIITGAVCGNVMAFLLGVLNHAPWGGVLVLPVIEGRIAYIASIVVGSLVTAIMVNAMKKEYMEETMEEEEIDLDFIEL